MKQRDEVLLPELLHSHIRIKISLQNPKYSDNDFATRIEVSAVNVKGVYRSTPKKQ